MSRRTDAYFKTFDNHRLYYERYQADKPKAVLIFLHGLGEHVGRYQNPIAHFKNDFTLYLYDQRGHGRSDGACTHVDAFGDFVRDLEGFIDFVVRQEKGRSVFLIAHSMGGQVALNYLGAHPRTPLVGFITSSANIRVAVAINPIKKFLGLNLAKFVPRLRVGNDLKAKHISRDQAVVQAYKKDPLISHDLTVNMAGEILGNLETLPTLAGKIKIPGFMLHAGNDKICAKQGTIDFFEHLGSEDKTLKIYDDCYHELFNELVKGQVFADMEEWLAERV
jgi:lysophospholipase